MKILWILPGSPDDKQNMIFAKRSIPALIHIGIEIEEFYVENRKSFVYLIKTWIKLKKKLLNDNFDAVHGQYGSIIGLLTSSLSKPYFLTIRGSDLNGDPRIFWPRRWIGIFATHWSSQNARRVICVSKELSEKLLVKTDILASPLDLSEFYPIETDIARSKLNINHSSRLIGFTGGNRPLKRKDLAKSACSVAGLNFLEIENVPPSDMPLWINACSAIILTSEREGSPNIVKEALACGVPVISVDVGDVGKWLIFDKYSKVTSPDIRSLVEALREHDHENPKRERRVDLSEENLEVHAMKLGHIYKKYIS